MKKIRKKCKHKEVEIRHYYKCFECGKLSESPPKGSKVYDGLDYELNKYNW